MKVSIRRVPTISVQLTPMLALCVVIIEMSICILEAPINFSDCKVASVGE